MPFERTIGEIFGAHGDALKDDIKVCLPATITAVHAATQTVDVQIAIKNPLFDEFGKVTYENQISVTDVPCGVMRGGGFYIWLPVAIGDSVLLMFSDLSMDTWRLGGNTPGWLGKHTHDSPIAIPCIAPDAKAFADIAAASGKVVIGKDGSQAQIRLSATDIELGAAAADFVALASKVFTELQKIQTTLLTGTSPSGAVVFGTPYTASPVASTLIKAQ
jgi:Phage protein Gp138 N-terminal domain